MNEYEALRDRLIRGDFDSVTPQSRNEAALKNAIASVGMEGLQPPQSRTEAYLAAFAEKVKGLPNTEKTILFDGTPTKLDLSSVGFGYAYLCSQDDLVSLAKGQDVHYEFTADGVTYSGVIDVIGYQSVLATPYLISTEEKAVGANSGYPFLIYAPTLGGTGFQLSMEVGLDVGEVTNIKLWTEYNENKPYFITGYYNGSTDVFLPTDQSKVRKAVISLRLAVKYLDVGGNIRYYTPTDTVMYGFGGENIGVVYDNDTHISIENGQPTL